MGDRERVAQAIYQAWADWESVTHDAGEIASWPDEAADAVLAALGDRVSRNDLLAKLKELQGSDDPEWAHGEADDLLLRHINDNEITEAFGAITKWYA